MAEKLVRDLLSDRIPAAELRIEENPESLRQMAIRKLHEEFGELADTDYSDVNEFADVLEVVLHIAKQGGITEEEVFSARDKKAAEKGRFERGLVWSGPQN
ncbi:nucleoside triphosphate pyrophosphohydrolase [Thalassospira xianhensis]|uniref:Predicted house-cleaning noncanonical NTP pyrophosphatase, all-alpha NTP-PPase (MazG) superfamily n=1 Tax=Thalassospira xiamenensis TaxID=220697 RepID=A0A285TS77_9PROT|nr:MULTISPECIES: nucleoside triphosphate pyrophosphohydrolase [Thalassospira]SOC26623.1 Predicted house-cleaning noncanonical NTP pyrophosphatase, all-alpha NTP-PPase (MazG) superfamily [Thalassospira xiamenensis]